MSENIVAYDPVDLYFRYELPALFLLDKLEVLVALWDCFPQFTGCALLFRIMSSPSSLTSLLPTPILRMIFSFLSYSTLVNSTKLVCKRFHALSALVEDSAYRQSMMRQELDVLRNRLEKVPLLVSLLLFHI